MQHPMPLYCHNLFKTSIIGSHVFMNMHAFELINDFGALFSLYLLSSCRIFRPEPNKFTIRARKCHCQCFVIAACFAATFARMHCIAPAPYANIWTSFFRLHCPSFTRFLQYFSLHALIQSDFLENILFLLTSKFASTKHWRFSRFSPFFGGPDSNLWLNETQVMRMLVWLIYVHSNITISRIDSHWCSQLMWNPLFTTRAPVCMNPIFGKRKMRIFAIHCKNIGALELDVITYVWQCMEQLPVLSVAPPHSRSSKQTEVSAARMRGIKIIPFSETSRQK